MENRKPKLLLRCTGGALRNRFFSFGARELELRRTITLGNSNQDTIEVPDPKVSAKQVQITSDCLLTNLSPEKGTWIKVRENFDKGEPLESGSEIKIGNYYFKTSEGSPDLLEKIWLERYGFGHLRNNIGNKSLNEINVAELSISETDKKKLQQVLKRVRKLPSRINKTKLSGSHHEFEVGFQPVTIGSSEAATLKLPDIAPLQAKIAFINNRFYIVSLDETNNHVYKKMSTGESIQLFPGRAFRIGDTEFEVCSHLYGKYSCIGLRPSMEDSCVLHQNLFVSQEPTLFCGVFDGHGGPLCASFLKKSLPKKLKERLFGVQVSEWPYLIPQVFKDCDQEFARKEPTLCNEQGSTAVTCLISGRNLVVSNLGDSRAVLCRAGRPLQLTTDHKPDSPEETHRIRGQGGAVAFGRVFGMLAVSRAFGDNEFKSPGTVVSVEPDTKIFELDSTDEFLLVACDGLFEAYTNEEVIGSIREKLRNTGDPNLVLKQVVEHAVETRQTGDNVSAFLIKCI